jgi:hypothetical protein
MSNQKIQKIKSNKRELLKVVGFKSIIGYRKANPNFTTNEEAYRNIQRVYNENIDKEIRRVENLNRRSEITRRVREAYDVLDRNKDAKNIQIDIDGLIQNSTDRNILLKALGNRLAKTVILTDVGVGYTTKSFETFEDYGDFNPEDYEGSRGFVGSDEAFTGSIPNTKSMSVSNVGSDLKTKQLRSGNYFKHTTKPECDKLKSIIPLCDFQIYDKIQDEIENCFIYSLKMSGKVTSDVLDKLKIFVKNKTVRKTDFNKIVDIIKCNIGLRFDRLDGSEKTKTNTEVFGKYEDTIFINLIDEHYFIEKQVNITRYALEHYEELKNVKDFNKIYRDNNKRTTDRYISSWDFVKYLIDNADRFLNKISLNDTELWKTNLIEDYVDTTEITNLEYGDECLKEPDSEIMKKARDEAVNEKNNNLKLGLTSSLEELSIGVLKYEKQDKTGKSVKCVTMNIFTDFETTTNGDIHTEYMMCGLLINEQGMRHRFQGIGENCCEDVLNQIRNYIKTRKYDLRNTTVNMIFHNAKYDVNFLISKCSQIQYLENGSQFVCSDMKYKGMSIKVKDSYKLLPFRLAEFGEIFNLDVKKELLPYQQYSSSNVEKASLSLYYETLLTGYKNSNVYEYVKNIHDWDCIISDDIDIQDTIKYHFVDEKYNSNVNYLEILKTFDTVQFDHIKYSLRYCELDCEVLQKGYTVFRKWILEMPDMLTPDINTVLTLPSLAFKIFEMNGCYDNVYQIGGILQHFINKTIVGGRVMTANNQKQKIDFQSHGDYVADFDGVSLYPSSYSMLQGFLCGVAKILREYQLNYDAIKDYDGYFVEIIIKSVGRHRNMPLGSFKDKETGTRNFTNDLVNKTLFVDKTTLEDLIEFQNITFDIVRGYYYDEGFNSLAVELMRKIFNERVKLKKLKNPAEQAYKLLMNSAYGKNIRKQSFTNTVICDNEDEFNKHMNRNYNFNKRFWKFGDKYRIETLKGLEFHYNYAHVGACILSMSKRIMNQVITCGEDIGINVYYQDTDSIHILRNDVNRLEAEYNSKYNRELIGKGLCQFHTDFNLNFKGKKYSDNVFSRKFIGLGKKCYVDELVLLDKTGKPMIDNEGDEIVDYHIRMKGVSNKAVLRRCEELKVTPVELYNRMYCGEKIDFDLLLGCDNETSFSFNKNMTVSSRRNEMNDDGSIKTYKFMRSLKF